MKRLFLMIVGCVAGSIVFGLIMTAGLVYRPELVFAGLVLFAIAAVILILTGMLLSIAQLIHMRQKYPKGLRMANSRTLSRQDRLASQAQLCAIEDPCLTGLSKTGLLIGVVLLITWLVAFLVEATCVLLFNVDPVKFLLRFLT